MSVEVVHNACAADQADIIRDGRADIGYLRLPADTRGLSVEPLFTEPRVVVLPADHRLAGKEAVQVADLAAERLLQNPENVPKWRGIDLELPDRQSRPAQPTARTAGEKLEHIAAGDGIVVVPLSTATFYTRPDVTHLPVYDIAACQVCLAWISSRPSPLVSEYVTLARLAS